MFVKSILLALAAASTAFAQNCGPAFGNQVCAPGNCCSQYGWCDTDFAHCNPANCQPAFSGPGSSCAKLAKSSTTMKTTQKPTTTKPTTTSKPKTTSTSTFNGPYKSAVPNIDVCGSGSGAQNISCPGAGINGYFYRCCSSHGHCGPKNNIQDQGLYCGVQEAGCQSAYGSCQTGVAAPPDPTGTPGVSQEGDTCGPIVNKVCASGLCCSGSNYCGTGDSFCGSDNWCQSKWGQCSGQP